MPRNEPDPDWDDVRRTFWYAHIEAGRGQTELSILLPNPLGGTRSGGYLNKWLWQKKPKFLPLEAAIILEDELGLDRGALMTDRQRHMAARRIASGHMIDTDVSLPGFNDVKEPLAYGGLGSDEQPGEAGQSGNTPEMKREYYEAAVRFMLRLSQAERDEAYSEANQQARIRERRPLVKAKPENPQ